MGIQLFRCEEGWKLKNSGALFGGNVCQSLTQTHRVCTQQSRGDRETEVCRDEPLEKKAERNPTPNYVDVSYTGADGQPVTQRVWFKLH
ncbi:hypothetical protein ACFW16_32600 [Inquilinus sp. NPDC058860]|uniref:hypothetical protein n=1 Tax=Inquilinus sp. NPDC058860 TaxID=3346652 RepID=UPI0036859DE6